MYKRLILNNYTIYHLQPIFLGRDSHWSSADSSLRRWTSRAPTSTKHSQSGALTTQLANQQLARQCSEGLSYCSWKPNFFHPTDGTLRLAKREVSCDHAAEKPKNSARATVTGVPGATVRLGLHPYGVRQPYGDIRPTCSTMPAAWLLLCKLLGQRSLWRGRSWKRRDVDAPVSQRARAPCSNSMDGRNIVASSN